MTRQTWKRHIRRLRDLMKTASDPFEPLHYFFDHLGEDKAFLDRSTPVPPAAAGILDASLQHTAEHLFGPGAPVIALLLCQYGALWHGSCVLGLRLGTVLYHRGLEIGLIAVPMGERTELVRFTVIRPVPLAGADQPWPGKGGAA